ncbi:DNA polymerase zeta catalytic subunit (Protein reversionless 3-like) (REV3-like) (hREV3) [Durusdinium trenchii]|uniref:DNA polymerase n=1 Tax=Durusdinium trenchii TaxID=1381693 RepID=A0ABP0JX19_9DINO
MDAEFTSPNRAVAVPAPPAQRAQAEEAEEEEDGAEMHKESATLVDRGVESATLVDRGAEAVQEPESRGQAAAAAAAAAPGEERQEEEDEAQDDDEEEEFLGNSRLEEMRMTLVYIDSYVSRLRRDPVLRLFGRRPDGKAVLVHVTGCFPYLFVKARVATGEWVSQLRSVLANSKFGPKVHALRLCSAIDFYGFRWAKEAFVKIELKDPRALKQVGLFLQSGNHELKGDYQPYETHIPFVMQFMSDYELAGMGWVRFAKAGPLRTLTRQTRSDSGIVEMQMAARDIIVDRQDGGVANGEDDEHAMSVPSLKGWLEEIKAKFGVDAWNRGSDADPNGGSDMARSASLADERVDQNGDTQVRDQLAAWLERPGAVAAARQLASSQGSATSSAAQSLSAAPRDVSTQEALELLQGFESSGRGSNTRDTADSDDGEHADDDDEDEEEEEQQDGNGGNDHLHHMTQAQLLSWNESFDSEEDGAAEASIGLEDVGEQGEAKGEASREVKRPRRVVTPRGSANCLTLRPREDPPTLEELISEGAGQVDMKHFELHQKPFFSNREDARLERHRYAPKAWIPAKDVLRQTSLGLELGGWLSLTPKDEPPRTAQVMLDLGGSVDKSKVADDGIEARVDKGARVLDDDDEDDNLERNEALSGIATAMPEFRLLIVEVIAKSTNKLTSNPERDEVLAIYVAVFEDQELCKEAHIFRDPRAGVRTERQVLERFAEFVTREDPDAIAGWEIQRASLGYLLARAEKIGLERYHVALSRIGEAVDEHMDPRHLNDAYGRTNYSEYWLPGRHVLNLWRIIRGEIDLMHYSLENVSQEFFGEPLTKYSSFKLYMLFMAMRTRDRALSHLVRTVHTIHRVVLHLDVITKYAEYSKLLGMDFFSTLTRGSQFRVESVMIRVAKPLNFVLPSPSKDQVASQPPLQYIALNLEPLSSMYIDPVAVLDFRSLYPSVIIANNLCFSTFVGKVDAGGDFGFEAGVFSMLRCDRGAYPTGRDLKRMLTKDDLLVLSNGAVFVKSRVREGVLPRMLREILMTRFAIKDALKRAIKMDLSNWKRVLDARQLALKLLANVTYGYTAASFSGRMPMATLADAIVLSGKQALQKCMRVVESDNAPWRHECPAPLRVVYGDTDSLFVQFPNCSLDGAFKIAKWIAAHMTTQFPVPMKLQMEKIYMPSMMVSKKRYCGMKFEHVDSTPKLESKGLENIRRDSCLIMQKIMNDVLWSLFTTRDLSITKRVFQDHLRRILDDQVAVNEFVFASKVRTPIEEKYKEGHYPPSAKVALNLAKRDPMTYPVHKQRVQYVVTNGSPASRLTDLVSPPRADASINAIYYIKHKILQPINRLLRLVNIADVTRWYQQLHRSRRVLSLPSSDRFVGRILRKRKAQPIKGIAAHFKTARCFACRTGFAAAATASASAAAASSRGGGGGGGRSGSKSTTAVSSEDLGTSEPICPDCLATPQETAAVVAFRSNAQERRALSAFRQCQACMGHVELVLEQPSGPDAGSKPQLACINTDCPVFYSW